MSAPPRRRRDFHYVSRAAGTRCDNVPTLTNFKKVDGKILAGNRNACFMNSFVQTVCTAFSLIIPLVVGLTLEEGSATYILEKFLIEFANKISEKKHEVCTVPLNLTEVVLREDGGGKNCLAGLGEMGCPIVFGNHTILNSESDSSSVGSLFEHEIQYSRICLTCENNYPDHEPAPAKEQSLKAMLVFPESQDQERNLSDIMFSCLTNPVTSCPYGHRSDNHAFRWYGILAFFHLFAR